MSNPDGTMEFDTVLQPKIIGYRQLTTEEATLMNQIKEIGNEVGRLVEGLNLNPVTDKRWVAIARTELQQGFMALTRAVAQPTSF